MNKTILIRTVVIILVLFIPIPIAIWLKIDIFYIKCYTLAISTVKTLFFIVRVVKQEIDLIKIEDFSHIKYIGLVCGSIFLIILSYSVDFFIVQYIDIKSFSGIPIDTPWHKLLFKMFYYSALFFFWMGVSNILPNSTCAEYITLSESLVTFFTLYYGTLNFVVIQKEQSKST